MLKVYSKKRKFRERKLNCIPSNNFFNIYIYETWSKLLIKNFPLCMKMKIETVIFLFACNEKNTVGISITLQHCIQPSINRKAAHTKNKQLPVEWSKQNIWIISSKKSVITLNMMCIHHYFSYSHFD